MNKQELIKSNMEKLKYYFVSNKSDDYGNCVTELIQTTPKNSKGYYYQHEVDDADILVLTKYFDLINFEEENERDDESRFYGIR